MNNDNYFTTLNYVLNVINTPFSEKEEIFSQFKTLIVKRISTQLLDKVTNQAEFSNLLSELSDSNTLEETQKDLNKIATFCLTNLKEGDKERIFLDSVGSAFFDLLNIITATCNDEDKLKIKNVLQSNPFIQQIVS